MQIIDYDSRLKRKVLYEKDTQYLFSSEGKEEEALEEASDQKAVADLMGWC